MHTESRPVDSSSGVNSLSRQYSWVLYIQDCKNTKDVISAQKQLSCKERCSPVQNSYYEKSCEIKGGAQEMAVTAQVDDKILLIDENWIL